MSMSELPEIKTIEQIVRRMSDAQFSELCSELGAIESLLGEEPNERRRTLLHVQITPDNIKHFVRTIRHVWPEAFDEPVAPPKREVKFKIEPGQIIGGAALLIIAAAAALMVISAINPPGAAVTDFKVTPSIVPTQAFIVAQRSPTPTPITPSPTPAPTETPDVNATLTATYAPSSTPTRTPTRTPRPTSPFTPTPASSPTPAVQIIYPRVELRKPASNSTVSASAKPPVQLLWIAPGQLKSDERYWLRFRQSGSVVYAALTPNSWYDGVPNGQLGTYQWSVAIVKVDAEGNVIGILGPESQQWTIKWQ